MSGGRRKSQRVGELWWQSPNWGSGDCGAKRGLEAQSSEITVAVTELEGFSGGGTGGRWVRAGASTGGARE